MSDLLLCNVRYVEGKVYPPVPPNGWPIYPNVAIPTFPYLRPAPTGPALQANYGVAGRSTARDRDVTDWTGGSISNYPVHFVASVPETPAYALVG
jgi:hypothetical protein